MPKYPQLCGNIAIVTAAALFGSFGWFIRQLGTSFSPLAQIVFRAGLACLMVGLLILTVRRYRQQFRHIPATSRRAAILIGLSQAVSIGFFTVAVIHIPMMAAVTLFCGSSLLTAVVITRITRHEYATTRTWLSSVIALAGLGCFLWQFNLNNPWVILAMLCGCIEGIANLLRKRLKNQPPVPILWYQYGTCALACLATIPLAHTTPVTTITWRNMAIGTVFAVLLLVVGALMLYGFAHTSLTTGTIIFTSEIAFAGLFGWLFYREVPLLSGILGALLITAATILAALPTKPAAPHISTEK